MGGPEKEQLACARTTSVTFQNSASLGCEEPKFWAFQQVPMYCTSVLHVAGASHGGAFQFFGTAGGWPLSRDDVRTRGRPIKLNS